MPLLTPEFISRTKNAHGPTLSLKNWAMKFSRLFDSATPFLRGNRFDRMEWAGAFGDLGTPFPFVAAYLSMLSLDPFGVHFSFGAAMIVCGLASATRAMN